jgi:hypothetical protein
MIELVNMDHVIWRLDMHTLWTRIIARLLGPLARAGDLRLDADALLAVPASLVPALAAAAVRCRHRTMPRR